MSFNATILFLLFNTFFDVVTTRRFLTVIKNTEKRSRSFRETDTYTAFIKLDNINNDSSVSRSRISARNVTKPVTKPVTKRVTGRVTKRVRRQLLLHPPDAIRYENKLKFSFEREEEPEIDNLQLLLQNGLLSLPWSTSTDLRLEDSLAELLKQENLLSQKYFSPGELTFHSENLIFEGEARNAESLEPKSLPLKAAQHILYFSTKDRGLLDQIVLSPDPGCVSTCDNDSDVIASVDTRTNKIVFCGGKNYDSVGNIKIFDLITSQQCSATSMFAIVRREDTVISSNISWNLTTSTKPVIQLNSTRVLEDSGYEIIKLSLGDLPEKLAAGEYHVTSSVGGRGTVRVFTVVCYDSVNPMSQTLDIQVLCKALGALEGDVTFAWEIPTADGDIITVSNSSSQSGYHVEEYLMGKFPISVLSIAPHVQRASRITLRCHATTKCGCRATGQGILMIWDLKPHNNVTKQGQEGFVSVTILGSDVSWPRNVFQMSRNQDRGLMSGSMAGYTTLQEVSVEQSDLS